MKRPSLSNLAQIAEIIAAVGVIISLAVVAVELRANTAAVSADASQTITSASRDLLLAIALDEDFARIRQIGSDDLNALTDEEAYRFYQFNRGNWLYFQNVWVQQTLGVIDQRVWESYERLACGLIDSPGNRQDWPNHVPALDPDFVAVIEGCLD